MRKNNVKVLVGRKLYVLSDMIKKDRRLTTKGLAEMTGISIAALKQ